jgi:DNA-directed RNA polymerase alpha subunit
MAKDHYTLGFTDQCKARANGIIADVLHDRANSIYNFHKDNVGGYTRTEALAAAEHEIKEALMALFAPLEKELMSISGLSRRAYNVLRSLRTTHSVVTARDLVNLRREDFKNTKNCGRKTTRELHQLLISLGHTPQWDWYL